MIALQSACACVSLIHQPQRGQDIQTLPSSSIFVHPGPGVLATAHVSKWMLDAFEMLLDLIDGPLDAAPGAVPMVNEGGRIIRGAFRFKRVNVAARALDRVQVALPMFMLSNRISPLMTPGEDITDIVNILI